MDVATGAMSSVLPKLAKLLNEEYKLPTGIRDDVKYLSQEMERMQAVLHKVGELRQDLLHEDVKLSADAVRKLSYDTDVVVDNVLVLASKSEGFKGLMEKMGNLLKKGKTRHQIIANEIKCIKAKVQRAAERCNEDNIYDACSATTLVDPRLLALYRKQEDLVGIDGKKYQELLKLLSDGDNMANKELKIVSVVGSGGLGKTTFVKAVFEEITRGFSLTAFVPVGQNAVVKKVLSDIIFCVDQTMYRNASTLDERQLMEKLWEILQNKRYLIVIDDIWNEKLWEDIKYVFSNKSHLASRIITTTRIVSVAKACCSSANDSIYQMEPLSNDDSKKLLYARIFGSVSSCPQEFEEVSSHILQKCAGVPLAIITMASILSRRPMYEWPALLNSVGHGLVDDCSEDTKVIISLSYIDLPPHLKTCLLHLSTFTESHVIDRYRLVKKWIAEGFVTQETKFIRSSNKKEDKLSQELSLEEVASQYLDELVNRNVIQPLESNNNCELISYHIHPMMHDVLRSIAIEEKFAAFLDYKDVSSRHCLEFRHLFIDGPNSENPIGSSNMPFDNDVRSLTVFGHANRFLLMQFKGTRVLDLEGCKSIGISDLEHICSMVQLKWLCLAKTQITHLPSQIGNLKHLEGLDVVGTQITQLPPQIGKLQNLKTLDTRKSRVKDIPDHVVRLKGLVNLLIGDNESSEGTKLPDGIRKMTSLQQLCTVDLRKCSESSLMELGELPHLKEIAVVSSDEPEVTRRNNVLVSSLDNLTELRTLVVYSDFKLSTRLQSSSPYKYLNCRKKLTLVRSLKVPNGFAGQHFLEMLDIRVCKLEEDDLKILGQLSSLRSLIVRFEVLPRTTVHITREGFAELESFYVDCRMPRVIFEERSMPKLEHLELKLYGGSASEGRMNIKHLLNLKQVSLWYPKWYATNKGVMATTDAVKTEVEEHQNEITFCIPEENKDGAWTMKTDIFPENRDAGCSRMTETEEVEEDRHVDGTGYILNSDNTEEGNLHQSSFAIASCSGTKEIEEVVE